MSKQDIESVVGPGMGPTLESARDTMLAALDSTVFLVICQVCVCVCVCLGVWVCVCDTCVRLCTSAGAWVRICECARQRLLRYLYATRCLFPVCEGIDEWARPTTTVG